MTSLAINKRLTAPASVAAEAFEQWSLETRMAQVRYMNFFTALLYLLYAYFESLMDLPYADVRLAIHGFMIPLFLLFIYRLSFTPSAYRLMRMILVGAPVSAVWSNLYFNMGTPLFAHFAPEIYLNIIWTFTMSGLTFRYALLAVSLSLSVTLTSTYLYWDNDPTLYLHCLWLLSAMVFGVVSALVLERMMRSIYKQQRELEHSASVDSLTGLWNRDKLVQLFKQEIEEKSEQQDYCLLMLDIDHFKSVNDQYGHIVGDKVLVQFAQLIESVLAEQGQVGRFGGEEFCALLPNASIMQASTLAEQLLAAIRQYDFVTVGNKTASIGLCQYRCNESFETLIARADKALYRAKEGGRDQIRSC